MDAKTKAKMRAMQDLHSLMGDVEKRSMKDGPMVSRKAPEVEETCETGERDGKAVTDERANPGDDLGEHLEDGHDAEGTDAALEKFLVRKGRRGRG